VNGGPLVLPDDAGACPAGRVNENGQCAPLPTYACADSPAVASSLSCAQAETLCTGGTMCTQVVGDVVECSLNAP
jgi:hypothetical protein